MNERIKELAEQAGLKVESWMTNPPKPFQILGSTEQFEKFAELIAKDIFATLKQAMLEGNDSKTDEIIDDRLQDAAGDVVDAYGIEDRIY